MDHQNTSHVYFHLLTVGQLTMVCNNTNKEFVKLDNVLISTIVRLSQRILSYIRTFLFYIHGVRYKFRDLNDLELQAN